MAVRVIQDNDVISVSQQDATVVIGSTVQTVETECGIIDGPQYQGALTVTPTRETQTLHTNGYLMGGDVTVNPIPSNYGLITWNGSVLTVS